MEGGGVEVCQTQARKVTQDVVMILWCENGIIETKPKPELSFMPEITPKFLNDLFILVWIESYCNEYKWRRFLYKHFKRLTKTPYLFATYFAHAGNILIETENATDIYKCFVDVLSLAAHFTLQYWQEKEDKKFLNCCVELFCAFFNKELCSAFEEQGSWKKFKEYLANHDILLTYKMLKRENKSRIDILSVFTSKVDSKQPFTVNGVTLKDITVDQVESDEKAISFADSIGDLLKKVCNKEFEEVLKDFQNTDNEVEKLYRKMAGAATGGMATADDPSTSQKALEEISESVPTNANPEESEDLKSDNPCDPVNVPITDSLRPQDQTDQILGETPPQDQTDQISAEVPPQDQTDQISSETSPQDQTGQISSETSPQDQTDQISSETSPQDQTDQISSETPPQDQTDQISSETPPQDSYLIPKENVEKAKELLYGMKQDIEKMSELVKFLCKASSIKVPKQVVDTKAITC